MALSREWLRLIVLIVIFFEGYVKTSLDVSAQKSGLGALKMDDKITLLPRIQWAKLLHRVEDELRHRLRSNARRDATPSLQVHGITYICLSHKMFVTFLYVSLTFSVLNEIFELY